MTYSARQWFLHLQFAGQLALAVFGDRPGRVLLARGLLGQGGSRGGQAGNVHQPLHLARLLVDGCDDVARAGLVDLVKLGDPARPWWPRRNG